MSTQVSVVMFLEQMISQCLWRASSWKNLAADRSFEAEGPAMSQTHQAFRCITIKSNYLITFKIHKHLSQVLLQFYVSLHLVKMKTNERWYIHRSVFHEKSSPCYQTVTHSFITSSQVIISVWVGGRNYDHKGGKRREYLIPPSPQCFWCAVTQCRHSRGTALPAETQQNLLKLLRDISRQTS